jgi:hypothetical protein
LLRLSAYFALCKQRRDNRGTKIGKYWYLAKNELILGTKTGFFSKFRALKQVTLVFVPAVAGKYAQVLEWYTSTLEVRMP